MAFKNEYVPPTGSFYSEMLNLLRFRVMGRLNFNKRLCMHFAFLLSA